MCVVYVFLDVYMNIQIEGEREECGGCDVVVGVCVCCVCVFKYVSKYTY